MADDPTALITASYLSLGGIGCGGMGGGGMGGGGMGGGGIGRCSLLFGMGFGATRV